MKKASKEEKNEDALSTSAIKRLTKAYREGGTQAEEVISKIERDPDFMFQTGNATGEYDLASAIIGTGRPNQQGLYVLPYLQSGHVLLLMILLIVAFVYYPGFPLTEAEDDVRLGLKIGLAITGLVNAGLSVLAYQSAGERRQPQLFWAFKTAILGNLAFNELRRNAPVFKEEEKTRSKKGKQST